MIDTVPGRTRTLLQSAWLATCLTACGGGGGGNDGVPPATNRAPVVVSGTIEAQATQFHPFSLDISRLVNDPDGDQLSFQLTRTWLKVVDGTITGTPREAETIEVGVSIFDGRGGSAGTTIRLTIAPNAVPEPTPIDPQLIPIGMHVNFEATRGGAAFTDADGDVLTYALELISPPHGLSVDGTHVTGAIDSAQAVFFRLTAEDAYGASAEQLISFAAAEPEPGAPMLPVIGFNYADDTVPVPVHGIRIMRVGSSWETMPSDNPTTDAGATLGRVLFYDKRLSITNTRACASCHVQSHGFASPERFDTGVTGVPLQRNSMALANARFNGPDRYFLDFRARTLETLALMPIQDINELGNSLPFLENKLASTDFYPPLFEAAFGSPEVTGERIAKALAQFLRSLLTYRSRFDEIVFDRAPPGSVLTAQELRGRALFDGHAVPEADCSACHLPHVVHTVDRGANNGLDAQFTDPGAGNGAFRAASLRNIAVTAPYMHDGRFSTLREVIDHYDHGIQASDELHRRFKDDNGDLIRLNLTEEDKAALEAFLHTLTDEPFLLDPKFSDPFK